MTRSPLSCSAKNHKCEVWILTYLPSFLYQIESTHSDIDIVDILDKGRTAGKEAWDICLFVQCHDLHFQTVGYVELLCNFCISLLTFLTSGTGLQHASHWDTSEFRQPMFGQDLRDGSSWEYQKVGCCICMYNITMAWRTEFCESKIHNGKGVSPN